MNDTFSRKPHDYSLCDHANGICTDYELTPSETSALIEHARVMREANDNFMAQFTTN